MSFCAPTEREEMMDVDSYCSKNIRSINEIHEVIRMGGISWIVRAINNYFGSSMQPLARDQVWDVFYTKHGTKRFSGYSTPKMNKLLRQEKKGIFLLKEILQNACKVHHDEDEGVVESKGNCEEEGP